MTKGLCLAGLLLTLAACGTKESKSDESNLRSDMPLRSAKYFMQNKGELTEVDTIWHCVESITTSTAVMARRCR